MIILSGDKLSSLLLMVSGVIATLFSLLPNAERPDVDDSHSVLSWLVVEVAIVFVLSHAEHWIGPQLSTLVAGECKPLDRTTGYSGRLQNVRKQISSTNMTFDKE
jgi:hypothetical protein